MAEETTVAFSPAETEHGNASLCVLIVEGGSVTSFPLPKQGTFVVGRAASADIRLNDARVSREHARLHVADDVLLEDLGSANGTLLRNRAMVPHSPIPVETGDAIVVGGAVLMVQPLDLGVEAKPSHIRPIIDTNLAATCPTVTPPAGTHEARLLTPVCIGIRSEASGLHLSKKDET